MIECQIVVKNEKLSFNVGDDNVEFNLFKATKFLVVSYECNRTNVRDYTIMKEYVSQSCKDPIKYFLLNKCFNKEENPR